MPSGCNVFWRKRIGRPWTTGQPRGTLTIGSLETTAALRLSPVFAAYAAAYPEVDLVLSTGTTCELIDAVLQHRLEGAFVCGPWTISSWNGNPCSPRS